MCDTCDNRQCNYCITKAYRDNGDCPRSWPSQWSGSGGDGTSTSDESESGW